MFHGNRGSQWQKSLSIIAVLLTAGLSSGPTSAMADAGGRVVAIGDIHGEYDGLVSILRETGLVNDLNQWIGGDATLVQTGDFLDRGPAVRKVMDLLMSLELQAPRQGGKVIVLLGNHEVMNVLGDYQDVSEEILSSFAGPDAEELREAAWKDWVKWLRRVARSRGGSPPELNQEKKARWLSEHPRGFVEYRLALGPEGKYGRWLVERPTMVRIGDLVFMHAGISPEYAEMSIDEVNELHRRQIQTFHQNRAELVKRRLIPSHFNLYEIHGALLYQSSNPPLERYLNPADDRLIAKASEHLNRLQTILLKNSPLWYRGYTTLPDEELRQHLDRLETTLGAHRFVVAHSPMETGSIRARLDGRVFLIDTGMLAAYYRGRASALEVADGRISAIYVNERQVLLESEDDLVPASAATSDSTSRRELTAGPANRRSGPAKRALVAAYPPQGVQTASRPPRVWKDPDGSTLPFTTAAEVEDFLRTARVVSQEDIPEGITKPKKILLESNGVRAHAKFNYVDRQGQRERLVDGTVEMYFLDSFKADMAAYELSRLLGMDSVPPGVVRSIDGQEGIVQLWIEGLTTYEDWLSEGNSGAPPSLYLERQVTDMRVFDLLIRNTDRNQGNIAWDGNKNLWLIDHTRSMARDAGLREPDKFKSCSREMYQAIKDLDEDEVVERLKPYLGSYEVKALLKRRDKLIKLMDSEIKKRGEDEVLFNYGDLPKGMVITYDDSAV